MKDAFERYEAARKTADDADANWENNPESTECEKAFNEAYKEEFNAFNSLADEIVKFTDNKIDEKTARTMIRTRYDRLKEIMAGVI